MILIITIAGMSYGNIYIYVCVCVSMKKKSIFKINPNMYNVCPCFKVTVNAAVTENCLILVQKVGR